MELYFLRLYYYTIIDVSQKGCIRLAVSQLHFGVNRVRINERNSRLPAQLF